MLHFIQFSNIITIMIHTLLIRLFILFSYYKQIVANVYNHSEIDLDTCKVHYSRSGASYKDFYPLTESPGADTTLLLDFHFSVLAPSDAHILLAPSENVQKGDPVYEIVVGAGGNTFCDIRRKQKADVKASVRVRGLLNALEPQSFWIHFTRDGNLSLGSESDEHAIISWKDPDPLPLKVISFSTWSGIEAKWYFDCDLNSKEVEKPLTDLERLRRDLLYRYDPYVRPVKNASTMTNIVMALNLNYVSLNEHKGTMEVAGVAKMAWRDEKLLWNPTEYGNIKTLHIFRREIWQPDLVLYNAIGDPRDLLEDALMVVRYTGEVQWAPKLMLEVFCDGNDLGTWPKDNHTCNVILGFMREFNSMNLSFLKNESSLIFQETSEWAILEADVISGVTFNEKNETSEPAIFEIILVLRRNSNIYNWLFFTPFMFSSTSMLLSFWMNPLGKLKISMECCHMVISTIVLLVLATIVPLHVNRVPYLVAVYSYSLVAGLVAMIISVFVINLARNNHHKTFPHILGRIITSPVLKLVLHLPNIKMPDKYGNLNDNPEKFQTMWLLLGTTIDRIAFLVYLLLAIFAVVLNNK